MVPHETKFDQVLQTCLEAIQQQNVPIEVILAENPQWKEDLQPLLESALWLHQRRQAFSPQFGFLAFARQKLEDRIQLEYDQKGTPGRRPFCFFS